MESYDFEKLIPNAVKQVGREIVSILLFTIPDHYIIPSIKIYPIIFLKGKAHPIQNPTIFISDFSQISDSSSNPIDQFNIFISIKQYLFR